MTMLSYILMSLLSLVIFIYFQWKNSRLVRLMEKMPGPPSVPVLGSFYNLSRDSHDMLITFHKKWVEQFGRIHRVWMGFLPRICISSPIYAEIILNSQKYIEKGRIYNFIKPWLGDGLLIASGDKWRKNRRLLTPAFHFQILDHFFEIFQNNSKIFIQQINKAIEENRNQEIDMYPFVTRCTLDIICETAMGVKVNAQIDNSEYAMAVNRLTRNIAKRITRPWMMIDWIFYFTAQGREYFKLLHQVRGFTAKVVQQRKEEINSEDDNQQELVDSATGLKKRRAFLDLLLISAKNGSHITEDEIRDEVDTFMFEGHDTTAAAISWFLYCMAINPDKQELLWNELNDHFDGSDRPCSMEDIPHLKYLECCIKETLRLYPSVPFIERKLQEDVTMGKYVIPAGASVAIQIYALHRNPDYFPEPLVFRPERFRPEESAGRHPYAYIPFSAGSRNCIGQRFALLEEKAILADLIRQFQFRFSENRQPLKECSEVVLKPQIGVPLLVSRRS